MAKRLVFDAAARDALRRGVEKAADVLKVTLGPRGRHVILDQGAGAPAVTNDGVTIARQIELADPFENAGARMLREAATRTGEVAGDGTTTATVLARAMVLDGLRAVAAGANAMQLKRGLDHAVAAAVADLATRSRRLDGRDDIAHVAAVAAGNDGAVGELLADAMDRVGRDGVVTVEESAGTETRLEVAIGMQLDRGYLSPYFVTDPETMEVVLEDVRLLLHDRRIASLEELLPALQLAAREGRPLLVVAEEIEGEALAALVVNKLRGTLASCAVRAPAFGDRRRALLEDLAVLTGARLLSPEEGRRLEAVAAADLGRARRVVIDRATTTVMDGGGARAAIDERLRRLRHDLARADSQYDREQLAERLARLAGGVALLRVGAPTEPEMKERKARVDDALAATRSALEEGIVPGGGVALLRAVPAVARAAEALARPDERRGAGIVVRALAEPARRIAENAGAEPGTVVARVAAGEGAFGFNALTGRFEDLMAAGIVDPAKVVRTALVNAASIAGLVITAETLVVEVPETEEEEDG